VAAHPTTDAGEDEQAEPKAEQHVGRRRGILRDVDPTSQDECRCNHQPAEGVDRRVTFRGSSGRREHIPERR
jgi:hypothetical protein